MHTHGPPFASLIVTYADTSAQVRHRHRQPAWQVCFELAASMNSGTVSEEGAAQVPQGAPVRPLGPGRRAPASKKPRASSAMVFDMTEDDDNDHCGGAAAAPLRPGSKNLAETFQFARVILQDLGEEGRSLLAAWYQTGLLLKTAYSGMGCVEMALAALHDSLVHDFGFEGLPPAAPIESCDVSRTCRQVLLGHEFVGTKPKHVFFDLLDRLPVDVQMAYRRLEWPSKAWLLEHSEEQVEQHVLRLMRKALRLLNKPHAFGPTAKAYCAVHDGNCLLNDVDGSVAGGETGASPCIGIRIAVGGLVCVHWSQAGGMTGFAGASAKPCILYVEERRAQQEPFSSSSVFVHKSWWTTFTRAWTTCTRLRR